MLLYSRQEASSEPSEQSVSPSQMAARAIHSPLAQVASEKPQAVGGRVVGTRPAKCHYREVEDGDPPLRSHTCIVIIPKLGFCTAQYWNTCQKEQIHSSLGNFIRDLSLSSN